MKKFKNIVMENLVVLVLVIVFFGMGFLINKLTGIEIIIIPFSEKITLSEVVYIILVFLSVSRLYANNPLHSRLMIFLGESPEIVVEVDNNFYLVPEYLLEKSGTQLNERDATITHTGTVFHFDFLLYNKNLQEATIKEVRMILGIKDKKVFIGKSFAITAPDGHGLMEGPEFKQFLTFKTKSMEKKITFSPNTENDILMVDEYDNYLKNIVFEVYYTDGKKLHTIRKKINTTISKNGIDSIKTKTKSDLFIWFRNMPDIYKCKKNYDFYCKKGQNHIFQVGNQEYMN